MNNDYKIINDQWIEITSGKYEGVVYKYGKVQLIEEGDQLRIKFDYHLPGEKTVPDDQQFIDIIGPILTELIEQGIAKNSIVYTGGVDEN